VRMPKEIQPPVRLGKETQAPTVSGRRIAAPTLTADRTIPDHLPTRLDSIPLQAEELAVLRKGRLGIRAAGVALASVLFLGGIGLSFLIREAPPVAESQPPPVAESAPPPREVEAAAEPAAIPAPVEPPVVPAPVASPLVMLKVTSTPAARVSRLDNHQVLGTTPLSVQLESMAALKLELTAPGYKTVRREVPLKKDATLNVTLVKGGQAPRSKSPTSTQGTVNPFDN
jgi:hypothetical protein